MPDSTRTTKDELVPAKAQRDTTCALTGDTIKEGDACFWVLGFGVIRGDLDPDEVQAKLQDFDAKFKPTPVPATPKAPKVSYQELCERLAQEFEAALVELKRRGLDVEFDDDALKEYRDLHPRQDA